MVKSLISILNAKQNSILSGAFILMVMVFATKFLGLIRDRLLVHQFDSSQAAIFFAAFRMPDLMFQLLIFGALSVAFIPVFTEILHHKGEKAAFEFANDILNIALIIFGAIGLVVFVFVGFFNSLLIPGFVGEQKVLTDQLTQIILVGQFLLVVGAMFVGITQSFQRFIIPALAPFFYNLGIIIGIVFLSPFFGIAAPAYGVVIGAALHVLVQLPLVNSLGFRYRFSLNFLNSGVGEVVKLMSARNISLAIEQISETVSLALASLISYASVTLLTFASHLQVVPIGLFGATISQAALPVLSKFKARGEMEQFKQTFLTTFHQILFLTLPSAAILIVLRIPVVRLAFGAAQFSWIDTVITGKTLASFSFGLAAQSEMLLIVRAFYALKDTKTPLIVSFVSVVVNVVVSLILVKVLNLDVSSLGISYALSSNISLFMLLYLLNKKVAGFNLHQLIMPGLKMLIAASVAALALYLPLKALDQLVFDTTKTVNLIFLTGIASTAGLGIYLLMIWVFRVHELAAFMVILRRFKPKVSVDTEEIIKETGRV